MIVASESNQTVAAMARYRRFKVRRQADGMLKFPSWEGLGAEFCRWETAYAAKSGSTNDSNTRNLTG